MYMGKHYFIIIIIGNFMSVCNIKKERVREEEEIRCWGDRG